MFFEDVVRVATKYFGFAASLFVTRVVYEGLKKTRDEFTKEDMREFIKRSADFDSGIRTEERRKALHLELLTLANEGK